MILLNSCWISYNSNVVLWFSVLFFNLLLSMLFASCLPICWSIVYMILLCYDSLTNFLLGILQFWRLEQWILPQVLLMQSSEIPRSLYLCKYILNLIKATKTIVGLKSYAFYAIHKTSHDLVYFDSERWVKCLLLRMGMFWKIPSTHCRCGDFQVYKPFYLFCR